MTLHDLAEKLKKVEEVTLMETLEISSEELVDRFLDRIEEKFETLEIEFDDTVSWDND
jgi:ribosome assembly protein YihI (activator of Der GTPase)